MQVFDLACSLISQVIISGEGLSCFHILLNLSDCHVLNEPVGLLGVNLYYIIVDSLVEGNQVGSIVQEGAYSLLENLVNSSKCAWACSLNNSFII